MEPKCVDHQCLHTASLRALKLSGTEWSREAAVSRGLLSVSLFLSRPFPPIHYLCIHSHNNFVIKMLESTENGENPTADLTSILTAFLPPLDPQFSKLSFLVTHVIPPSNKPTTHLNTLNYTVASNIINLLNCKMQV